MYFSTVYPQHGTSLLIFAFIVVVIGGLGSISGTAIAAIVVGLVQQFANYYARPGRGRQRGGAARRRPPAPPAPAPGSGRVRRVASPGVSVVLAGSLPWSTLSLPGLFEGPLNSPGTLQLLAVCLVFGALALGYDLLFGRAGLLSFGHALYIAAGAYGVDIWSATTAGRCGRRPWSPCLAVGGPGRAARLGRAAHLGIAFSMVTLAFAQVG